jgi:hypothetical protein
MADSSRAPHEGSQPVPTAAGTSTQTSEASDVQATTTSVHPAIEFDPATEVSILEHGYFQTRD